MRAVLAIAVFRIQHGTLVSSVIAGLYILERYVTLRGEVLRWIYDAKGARSDL